MTDRKFMSTLAKFRFDPSIKVHSNDLFSESTAPMVFKFYMQHDKAAGLQNDKIQAGQQSKMAAVAKNSKPL